MTAAADNLLEAALAYAARGWPVFPCNPKNKQPLLAAQKDSAGNKIRGTGGVSAASTDADKVRGWWKRWPKALIGLATGHPTLDAGGLRLFVVDFDPRADESTGEIWTLQRLKADFEELILCTLPESLTALTPSDGVHLYLLQADDGEAVKNSASKFTDHVDVRGLGGYVIAPPGTMADDAIKGQGGLRYRWHRREPIGGIAKAPEGLVELLRNRKAKPPAAATSRIPPGYIPTPRPPGPAAPLSADDVVRRYALSALDGECREVRDAPSGKRNAQLNISALKIASLVAAGAIEETLARSCLEAAARDNPGNDDDHQLQATIDSGWTAGLGQPRDLNEIAAAARSRSDRGSRPGRSDRRPPAPAGGEATGRQPFQSGRAPPDPAPQEAEREISEADEARLARIASAWLTKRLERDDLDAEQLRRAAFGAGCRIAAGLLGEDAARAILWESATDLPDASFDELERALGDGFNRGYDPGPTLLDLELARLPMTDFGIAERFRSRYGSQYRFTTAQGWLGWDGQRWKLLDQDKDTSPAEVIAAAFDTIRAIQREARRVGETGTKWELVTIVGPKGGEREVIDDDKPPNPHALDYWMAKGRGFIRFSEQLAIFGRAAEQSSKPAAVTALARQWLTVPIEQFDCEQMAINALNGTLRFAIEQLPDGSKKVAVRLDPHNRADLITKLAPVDYDPQAPAPLYDAMVAWAQPDPEIRRYLHQVGGYACSGDTGEHLLWFNYGRGRNGKSTTIDSWCSATGDYSGTIGIESFLDQGIKKRGDQATPDLAKLGGVRMLRASEPERGAKLNAALIKAATGGEPMSVRALHRGFFDLLPRFKLLMSGNSKPNIPDTDEGIWGRMKLVPWLRHIEKPEEDPYREQFPASHAAWPAKDPKLTSKIKATELAGVFRRLVEGLVDYLEQGFLEPQGVTIATADYRNQSDPLARFLGLCTERDPDSRVKSSELHELFAAWCKAAGEKEWTQKGFSDAMIDKGYTKTRSDGMRWEKLRMTRAVSDFVDHEGRPRVISDDLTLEPPPAAGPPGGPLASFQDDDDDVPRQ